MKTCRQKLSRFLSLYFTVKLFPPTVVRRCRLVLNSLHVSLGHLSVATQTLVNKLLSAEEFYLPVVPMLASLALHLRGAQFSVNMCASSAIPLLLVSSKYKAGNRNHIDKSRDIVCGLLCDQIPVFSSVVSCVA